MSTPEGLAWLNPHRARRDHIWNLLTRHGIRFHSMDAYPLSISFTISLADSVPIPEGLSDDELVVWAREHSSAS